MHNWTRQRLTALVICMVLFIAACAHAVTYTEDGGMIVNGEGTDDFTTVEGTNSNYDLQSIVTLPPDTSGGDKGPGPTFVKSDKMDFFLVLEDGSMEYVEMLAPGTIYSQVKLNGEKTYVDTCHLVYDIGEVPDDHRFAIINAQKNGFATMHNRASAKSDVVGRFMTNRICLVLDVGEKYTRVWVDDCVGFIQTGSLIFMDGREENTALAQISYKGRTNSKATINIHMNGKNRSRILDDLICGTQMTVFSTTEDGWTEIEAGGWRGWILSEYVTYGAATTASLQ